MDILNRFCILVCALGAICCVSPGVWAEELPNDPVRIAVLGALSGSQKVVHVPHFHGARHAVGDANEAGGVLGRRVELLELDTRGAPLEALVMTEQAVKAGVAAIIGPMFSSQCLVAARVAQQAGVPLVATVSTHPGITTTGDKVFRLCFTDEQQADALATVAHDIAGGETAVIILDAGSDYSMYLSESFKNAFLRHGGTVLDQLEYVTAFQGHTAMLERVKSLGPDILFVPGNLQVQEILAEAVALGVDAVPVGGDGWSTLDFSSAHNAAPALAYHTMHWIPEMGDERTAKLIEPLPEPFGMGQIAVLAYDAVSVILNALERSGSDDPARVREALAATQGYPGLAGDITFTRTGDVRKKVSVVRLEQGRKVFHGLVETDVER